MNSSFRRLSFATARLWACVIGLLPHAASALDTPNVLMGIDGMVVNASGLFRDPAALGGNAADGFNTFIYFNFGYFAGMEGRYKSFYVFDNVVDPNTTNNFGGISHNARYHSDTPETFVPGGNAPVAAAPLDLSNAYYPIIDRGSFGQIFDPAEYQLEVKYKPNGVPGGGALPLANEARTFNVLLDQMDGFVFDAEAGIYKRASDSVGYTIGTEEVGLNDFFATAPKDADGFATYIAPLSTPTFVQRSFYHVFGDNPFRDAHVVAGGGKMQNPDLTYSDVTDGLDTLSFGGGPTDPNRPNSQLRVPNGLPFIGVQSQGDGPDETRVFSLEIRSIALKRINPSPIVSRIDANSGLSFRFGTGLSYSTAADAGAVPPINVPGDAFPYVPNYTNQITRFDQNGMTNLIINPRSGPDPNEGYRFFIRGAPSTESFDGKNADVVIRAKLTQPLTNAGVAQNMTIYARDLDGSDNADPIPAGPLTIPPDPVGADDYSFNLALNQFNSSTFTTVTIPLESFTLNTMAPTFTNPGDGLLEDFNVYEFGAFVPNGGGLLRLELEYMEIRLAAAADSDFNSDGIVNGADFLIWQRGLGMTGQTSKGNGDANGDGTVNGADLALWKARFGGAPEAAAAGAVPEPATLVLAVFALAFRRPKSQLRPISGSI
jgi:hypothetical protein